MTELSGTLQLAAKADSVFQFLMDPDSFSRCLPTLEYVKKITEGSFEAKFRIAIPKKFDVGYLSTVGAKMLFNLQRKGDQVTLKGEGRVIGSKMQLELVLDVLEGEAGTALSWRASLDTGILSKVLGEEAIRETSEEVVSGVTRRIKEELC